LKLTQRQIAEQIGVTEATIYHWEGQRTVPKLPSTQRIIAFLGYIPFETPNSISEKIKNCRKVLGLTQERMAEMIGINETTLKLFEAGKRRPTAKTLKLIEAFLGRALQNNLRDKDWS
jgi:transcriptional regulator with XRE-family HTH domain